MRGDLSTRGNAVPSDHIAPGLVSALERVTVAPGALAATVDGREVTAKSPHDMTSKLAGALYDAIHVGRTQPRATRQRSLRDARLDAMFAAAMPFTHTAVTATLHLRAAQVAVVAIAGLRLEIPASLVPSSAAVGDEVSLRLPAARPALSPGFFLADGSAGSGSVGAATLRLYAHLADPDSAAGAWHAALTRLEGLRLHYRAKVLSARSEYPRHDALVIYLGRRGWGAVLDVAEEIRDAVPIEAATSPFTHCVAPGISVAWEPRDLRPGQRGLSFGQHRAH
ncbi:MAG TPA: T3SS effector HopA1 family protein, partial [Jatrophihabitantaceae bacterium]|nr:T3SS effector HopA1 family protein [Jatrophihabitantaceae bacterium]